eukprot:TRINITY_DN14657_c0_g1_i1.p1 TRINITY_DN14657_c0_g1~~TRINITY_DN14657_c0_g1_i1.p1  ORF type:complete len:1309 (+),score=171.04 TRINITY_DN14657_c0_g1_i1:69-3995(+)
MASSPKSILASQFIEQTTNEVVRDCVAIVDNCASGGPLEITYHELGVLVRNMSELLKKLLCRPKRENGSSTVAILLDEGIGVPIVEMSVLFLDALKFVPLDPVLPPERISFLLGDSETTSNGVIVTTVDYLNAHKSTLLTPPPGASYTILVLATSVDGVSLNCDKSCFVSPDTVTSLSHYHAQPCLLMTDTAMVNEVISKIRPGTDTKIEENPSCDDLYIIYTSGSTGVPKGILGTSLGLGSYLQFSNVNKTINSIYFKSPMVNKKPGDRVLMCSAVSWDPSVSDIFSTLLNGGTLILEPRAKVMNNLQACIEDNDVTQLFSTPALWRLLFNGILERIDQGDGTSDGEIALSTLRCICLGGEPWGTGVFTTMDKKSLSELSKGDMDYSNIIFVPIHLTECYNVYGVTECTVVQFTSRNLMEITAESSDPKQHHDSLQQSLRWLGHLFPNSMYSIISPTQDSFNGDISLSSTTLTTGELVLSGPQVLQYHGVELDHLRNRYIATLPPETVPEGVPLTNNKLCWFRTGDKVSRGELPNTICLMGRLDRQVKINGYRVELGEVEDSIERLGTCSGCSGKLIRTFCNLFASPKSTNSMEAPNRLVASVFLQVPAPGCERCRGMLDHLIPFSEFSIILHAWCESLMPRHQVPHMFLYMTPLFPDGIPLTVSGMKVDGNRIRAESATAYKQTTDTRSTQLSDESRLQNAIFSPTENWVRSVWASVLSINVNEIDGKSHFFELGGDSQKAIIMVGKLKKSTSAHTENAELTHRKLCGLLRKPRLKEYSAFLDWVYYDGVQTTINTELSPSTGPAESAHCGGKIACARDFFDYLQFPTTEMEILYKAMAASDAFSVSAMLATGRVDPLFGGRAVVEMTGKLQENTSTMKTCISDLYQVWSGSGSGSGFRSELKKIYQNTVDLGGYPFKDGEKVAPPPPLLFAFCCGDLAIVEVILSILASVFNNTDLVKLTTKDVLSWTNNMSMTGLMLSCKYNSDLPVSFFKKIVEQHGAILRPKDTNQWCVFFHAVANCQVAIVRYLLEGAATSDRTSPLFGINFLTQFDRWGNPPLLYAVKTGSIDLCGLLIASGASQPKNRYSHINIKVPQRAHRRRNNVTKWETPLHLAVRLGQYDIVSLLLSSGCSIKENRDDDSKTALHVAALTDNFKMVSLLLSSKGGPDAVNELDVNLRTALFYSTSSAIKEALLSSGSDVLLRDRDGCTYAEYQLGGSDDKPLPTPCSTDAKAEFQTKGRFNIAVDIAADSDRSRKKKKDPTMWDRCFRCWETGHTSKVCTNEPKCKICGGNHESRDHGKASSSFE